jgi:hypothetical protein
MDHLFLWYFNYIFIYIVYYLVTSLTYSQTELTNRRNEFWDTRVDGNAIIWQTLRRVSEAILTGETAMANVLLTVSTSFSHIIHNSVYIYTSF